MLGTLPKVFSERQLFKCIFPSGKLTRLSQPHRLASPSLFSCSPLAQPGHRTRPLLQPVAPQKVYPNLMGSCRFINIHINCMLYPASCILYPISCSLYPVSCIQYSVYCIVVLVSCILHSVSFILYSVSCIVYRVSQVSGLENIPIIS